jgi:hypothetical protein
MEKPVRRPRRSGSTRRSSTPKPGGTSANFPQAFSHLALIQAAPQIILAEIAGGDEVMSH